jgi:hypothetical protein
VAITIGERVQAAIDYMEKGEVELALSDICIAIDITSQKYYGQKTHLHLYINVSWKRICG